MSGPTKTIVKSKILDALEKKRKKDEDFDALFINTTNTLLEKKLKADDEHARIVSSIKEDSYAHLANLMITKKLSRGILEFSIKNWKGDVWDALEFKTYMDETFPEFALSINVNTFLYGKHEAKFVFSLKEATVVESASEKENKQ
jgi:hypothetical protein